MIESKLFTERQVYDIARLTLFGKFTNAEIAKMYKVSESAIRRIWNYVYRNRHQFEGACSLGRPSQYWENEDEILASLSLEYKPEQLKGEELVIYNNLK